MDLTNGLGRKYWLQIVDINVPILTFKSVSILSFKCPTTSNRDATSLHFGLKARFHKYQDINNVLLCKHVANWYQKRYLKLVPNNLTTYVQILLNYLITLNQKF